MAKPAKDAFACALSALKREEQLGDDATLARLACDDRMQNVRYKLGEDQEVICRFLRIIFDALCACAGANAVQADLFQAERRAFELREAIRVVLSYCESGLVCTDFPADLRGLPPMLRELGTFVHSEARAELALIRSVLPTSRKARPNIRTRVHFSQLMVSGMQAWFGQPSYQDIADTMNVLFDLPETEEATAESVRKAAAKAAARKARGETSQ